jgi:hypothetical protein
LATDKIINLAERRTHPHKMIVGVCTNCCNEGLYFIPEPEDVWHVTCADCGHPTVGPIELDQDTFDQILEDFINEH